MYDKIPPSIAAELGHSRLVERLLDRESIDANIKQANARTRLSWLTDYSDAALAKHLADRTGPNIIKVADVDGRSPLLRAAEYGN